MLSGLTSGEVSGHVIVACFLIREGADVRAVGETALDSCDPEVAVILSTFAGKYAGYIAYLFSVCSEHTTCATTVFVHYSRSIFHLPQ